MPKLTMRNRDFKVADISIEFETKVPLNEFVDLFNAPLGPAYPPPPTPGDVSIRNFNFRVTSVRTMVAPLRDTYTGRVVPKLYVELDATVNHRDDGSVLPLTFSRAFPAEMTEHEAVRSLMLDALRHEADECILVNGVRVNDPHAHGRRDI
jgi:hypothetical protein